jgi:hypothetical protein
MLDLLRSLETYLAGRRGYDRTRLQKVVASSQEALSESNEVIY